MFCLYTMFCVFIFTQTQKSLQNIVCRTNGPGAIKYLQNSVHTFATKLVTPIRKWWPWYDFLLDTKTHKTINKLSYASFKNFFQNQEPVKKNFQTTETCATISLSTVLQNLYFQFMIKSSIMSKIIKFQNTQPYLHNIVTTRWNI